MEFDYEASLERLKLQQKKLEALFKLQQISSEDARIRSAWSIWKVEALLRKINKLSD